MTSPGEPRTASGQAGGLRAAGRRGRESAPDPRRARRATRGKGGGGAGGCAAGPGAGGRPRSLAPARLRLGLRAARSASLALQVPVTHTDTGSRPSRSIAPPPRRRSRRRRAGQTHRRARTQVAGNEHVGHPGGRAQRGERGRVRPGELRRQARAATARPGSEPDTAAAAGGGQVGGGGGGKRWGWEKPGEGVLRPAHSLPFLFCLLPQRGHPTRGRGSWYPEVAGLNPPSSSSPCAAGTKAPRRAGPGPKLSRPRAATRSGPGAARPAGTPGTHVPAAPRVVSRPLAGASSEKGGPRAPV